MLTNSEPSLNPITLWYGGVACRVRVRVIKIMVVSCGEGES